MIARMALLLAKMKHELAIAVIVARLAMINLLLELSQIPLLNYRKDLMSVVDRYLSKMMTPWLTLRNCSVVGDPWADYYKILDSVAEVMMMEIGTGIGGGGDDDIYHAR